MLTGCATSTINQSDTIAADGSRITTTETKIRAFFASESKVSDVLLTTDTEGQQTALGTAENRSTESLNEFVKSIAEGVAAGLVPVP